MRRIGTVHAIHGYLGAGKTTFALKLEAETAGVRLSIDEWTIGLSGERSHLDPGLFDRTSWLLNELWPRIAVAGADVILDFGFWTRASRDDARARAGKVGADFRLYALQCDDATAIARCRARTEPTAYVFDAVAFKNLRSKFEPLEPDEVALTVPV